MYVFRQLGAKFIGKASSQETDKGTYRHQRTIGERAQVLAKTRKNDFHSLKRAYPTLLKANVVNLDKVLLQGYYIRSVRLSIKKK